VDARRRGGGAGGNAKDASEAENEGQSMMSGHLDVVLSGGGDGEDEEDGEAANQRKPKRKKPYNRHTPRQIEQLES
jgi:homeobox-leucine zipper protein